MDGHLSNDESHNLGHGHVFEAYGVDSQKGALVVVCPCELLIVGVAWTSAWSVLDADWAVGVAKLPPSKMLSQCGLSLAAF